MRAAVTCALCGKAGISRRLDLTFGEVDPRNITDFTVLSVGRGLMLCPSCIAARTVADVLEVASSGVSVIRGCLVQCTGRSPWWMRRVMPGGPRVWRKVVCPSCEGRAQVQPIWQAVERPPSAFREGLRQAAAVLSLRRDTEGYDDGMDDPGRGSDAFPAVSGTESAASIPELADQRVPAPESVAGISEQSAPVSEGIIIGNGPLPAMFRGAEDA